MPEKKHFLNFIIEPELLKRVDDYRFENRLESRAEAIRQLIEAGLAAKGRE